MVNLKHKKHLFFDFDDTLWDFKKNSTAVLNKLFYEYSLNEKLKTDLNSFLDVYKKINLLFWSKYTKKEIDKTYLRNNRFKETFKLFDYTNEEDNLIITEQYLRLAPQGSELKEGCVDTLEYLKKNYHLHIITNGFREVFAIKMNACGIRDYFDQIIISEEHKAIKPDVKIFRLAESFAKAKSDECVMIGDSLESDVQGALNAGWEAIHFNEEELFLKNEKTISKLVQLKNYF
ncbi:YjjG family noncanonical pyrimidine nucleotidase [Aurantibacillus circumpalustris]|uniref:YjjG family noncanonical pyrimidine nucleotidase n=1 Tax=Aurantibacillus circumpalustris TaxID=3036359 RepID=UPI00295ACB7D|nr:YjjG family noncanonical pyrimidine nucleotidase [Aurantibacillus circumpalustris]